MTTPARKQNDAIERARYKLRQADLALQYLRQVPKEIAVDIRQARTIRHPDIRLDTFFFSCLGLAKSAFYIIDNGRYKDAIHDWRTSRLDQKGRTQFNKMMTLRDIDVHQGQSDGRILATMIPLERSDNIDGWRRQQQPNDAVFGIRPPVTEHKNPDGSTARSFSGLQGTLCLYVDIAGETWEAANACEHFISQLSSMIDAVEVASGAV